MRSCPGIALATTLAAALAAAPAAAQGKKTRVALGYAFAHYLEEGEGNAPVGGFFAVGSAGRTVGLELDVAYHRDPAAFDESLVLSTLTAALGPRFVLGSGGAQPFLRVLGGVRHDSLDGESSTALGGAVGAGVDVPIGASVFVRLAGDLQIFYDERDYLETLRLAVGVAF